MSSGPRAQSARSSATTATSRVAPSSSPVPNRLIGLSLEELQRIPAVVAVAAEAGKSAAILGALRSGVVTVLITECRNAFEVLRLAGVTDLEEEESLLRRMT